MATKKVNADLEVIGDVISGGDNLNEKIEYLEYLLPEEPLPLNGIEFDASQVSGGVQTANLADDDDSTYDYGMAAGDMNVPNIISDASPQILTLNSNRFDKANEGVMKLIINDVEKETLDLTQAGDGGGHLREAGHALERIDIVNYNDFEPYKKGRMRVYIGSNGCNLRAGANRIRLEHEIDGQTNGSADLDLFYDDGSNTPTILTGISDSLVTVSEPGSPAFLSGVKYLPAEAEIGVKVTAQNVFENTFLSQSMTVIGSQAGFSNQDISFVAGGNAELSGYSDPPQDSENFIVDKDIALEAGFFSLDGKLFATAKDPFTTSSQVEIPRQDNRTMLVNTYSQQSTDLLEKFLDENYRLPLAAYDSIPGSIIDQWISANVISNGNAQIAGSLIYPVTNYSSGYTPNAGQPDYSSSFTGDQQYLRAFRDTGDPHNSGILRLVGLLLTDIQAGGDVKVEIKLPGSTGWLDLGEPYDAGSFQGDDGDGCRTSVNGNQFGWSAGTNSTAGSGYMVIVRITLKNSSAPVITELQMMGW
ncbi:MAG: hypothetical protein P9X24_06015 [Candidatus Hatepunaea meridiana]|nr:hypothetical protein [Candidatus Hatepunaea meridiana]